MQNFLVRITQALTRLRGCAGYFESLFGCTSAMVRFLTLRLICQVQVSNWAQGTNNFFPYSSVVIPPVLVVKSSFQDKAGLPNFVVGQNQGLAEPKKKQKNTNTTVTSAFCDFVEAECSNPSIGRYQKFKF